MFIVTKVKEITEASASVGLSLATAVALEEINVLKVEALFSPHVEFINEQL